MLKAKDVLERAAFDVGDEYFQILDRKKMLIHLERVLRTFCRHTKLVNRSLGINLSSAQTDYPLTGLTEVGTVIGGDIVEIVRAEYNGKRIYENSYEDVMNARIDGLYTPTSRTLIYAIRFYKTYMMLYLPFTPSDGDKFIFWYVAAPIRGCFDTKGEESVIDIPQKYEDNLSPGLAVKMYDVLIMHYGKNKNPDLVRYLYQKQIDTKKEWSGILDEAKRDALGFKEQITPIQAQLPSIIHSIESGAVDR